MPLSDFSKELFSNFEGYGLQLCQAVPSNKNGSKCFAKTISFLFYLYEIYVQLFLRNTLLQISLIESIFYKKINEWYIEWQQVTTSDNEWYNEWQQITTSDSKWQRVV